jgi:biopolymer transport protein ExbD
MTPRSTPDRIARGRRRPRRGRGLPADGATLPLTSLLDVLTIVLAFFLKAYSIAPVPIPHSEGLHLPSSTAQLAAPDAVPVTLTRTALLVNDRRVAGIRDGRVDAGVKRDGDPGYFITPLYEALSSEAARQKDIARRNPNQQFDGLANVIADRTTPFRLLTEVLYTAGQAEFGKFKFAVLTARGE